ncbi:glycosyltransferase family 2 protein [Arsenicicoccus cauae]|uniref:glycosyltransferase family 2 protein n=1 Tax=Arsenicicoccus cauae TaxID=2663847 RepID=UPI0018A79CDD|nr:glycosyltransferase family A protein [Arsenicicoccus cauae]
MPKWSVIIPVRNGQEHLERALTSVLKTLPHDAEVRIMDDGSTDRTPDILAAVQGRDPRVLVHRHSEAQGVARSLNELAGFGDSEFLARMDADDVALPGRWTRGESLLRSADMAFTTVVFVDERGRPRGADQPGYLSAAATPLHLLLGCCLVHPTAMMRRSAFDESGGYADTKAEDYELWLRASCAGQRLVRSSVPGLLYRRHPGQVTLQQPWMDEGTDSPLWTAYQVAASTVLDVSPSALRDFFTAALHRGPVPQEVGPAITQVGMALRSAAERLQPIDRLLFTWRLNRQLGRMQARLDLS